MSRGQTPRTPANFPRMKHRAFGRQIASWGGGMICPCGLHIYWGKVSRAEYDEIQQELADHDAYCDEGLGDDEDPLAAYYADPVGLELVQAILDRKAGKIWGDEDDPWTQEELRLAAERNAAHQRKMGLT